ncbi:MAG: AAA family ATPase [Ilumatobacter sp.]|nr:AAA family ATPase [bacterium]NKB41140.1 AAA family ATPase [Ilumatobacter sp.]
MVAILNQKGGVGKTTVAFGLASAAQAARRRVLVIDLDPRRRAVGPWASTRPLATSRRPTCLMVYLYVTQFDHLHGQTASMWSRPASTS